MRNRNWDQDFDAINQANVNRMHVNRSGERQYDSGYSNNMGLTSYEQNMHDRDHSQNQNWVRTGEERYRPDIRRQNDYAPGHSHTRADYDERIHLQNRHPDENARGSGFFNRMGDWVGEVLHEGREQAEHLFDRFGNNASANREHGNQSNRNYDQGNSRYRENRQGQPDDQRWNARHEQRLPRGGYQNSNYNPDNQGQVQGNRYQESDYSARSSYRLLDSNSGYGQSGYSYASERDSD